MKKDVNLYLKIVFSDFKVGAISGLIFALLTVGTAKLLSADFSRSGALIAGLCGGWGFGMVTDLKLSRIRDGSDRTWGRCAMSPGLSLGMGLAVVFGFLFLNPSIGIIFNLGLYLSLGLTLLVKKIWPATEKWLYGD